MQAYPAYSAIPGSQVFAVIDGRGYWIPYGWHSGRTAPTDAVYAQSALHAARSQDRAKAAEKARLSPQELERVRETFWRANHKEER